MLALVSILIVGGAWWFRSRHLGAKSEIPLEAVELWRADSAARAAAQESGESDYDRENGGDTFGSRAKSKKKKAVRKKRGADHLKQQRAIRRNMLSDTIPVGINR